RPAGVLPAGAASLSRDPSAARHPKDLPVTIHRALGFRLSFDVDHEPLATYLAEVFGALAEPHGPSAGVQPFTVTPVEPDDDAQLGFDLGLGDQHLRVAQTAPQILDTIVQIVNAECVPSPGWLSSHAAGVSRGGEA